MSLHPSTFDYLMPTEDQLARMGRLTRLPDGTPRP